MVQSHRTAAPYAASCCCRPALCLRMTTACQPRCEHSRSAFILGLFTLIIRLWPEHTVFVLLFLRDSAQSRGWVFDRKLRLCPLPQSEKMFVARVLLDVLKGNHVQQEGRTPRESSSSEEVQDLLNRESDK
eukprot:1524799-Rhodomonas_salina.1